MKHTVQFGKITTFLGRNGRFNCSGLELFDYGDMVNLTALTGRGDLARCEIEIPADALPGLIEALQAIAMPHSKVAAGLCPVCKRHGEDCIGSPAKEGAA
jgi:hypothetical protein